MVVNERLASRVSGPEFDSPQLHHQKNIFDKYNKICYNIYYELREIKKYFSKAQKNFLDNI